MDIENNTSCSANNHRLHRADIAEQADQVYKEAKKLGSQIYDEGKDQFDALQGNIREHSDRVAQKVHENPLSSLAIAAGIGFIVARLLKH